MLALGFLIMIGMTLIADGFGAHVPKGYVYAAMGFSAAIEGPEHAGAAAARKGRPRLTRHARLPRSPPCGAGGVGSNRVVPVAVRAPAPGCGTALQIRGSAMGPFIVRLPSRLAAQGGGAEGAAVRQPRGGARGRWPAAYARACLEQIVTVQQQLKAKFPPPTQPPAQAQSIGAQDAQQQRRARWRQLASPVEHGCLWRAEPGHEPSGRRR